VGNFDLSILVPVHPLFKIMVYRLVPCLYLANLRGYLSHPTNCKQLQSNTNAFTSVHSRNPAAFLLVKLRGANPMAKQTKKVAQKVVEIIPVVDKYLIVKKLEATACESRDIAEYIDVNIHYGRALGYAEGKLAAYLEIAERILKGEFDPMFEEDENEHGYEM
jgi:hypothetical protein